MLSIEWLIFNILPLNFESFEFLSEIHYELLYSKKCLLIAEVLQKASKHKIKITGKPISKATVQMYFFKLDISTYGVNFKVFFCTFGHFLSENLRSVNQIFVLVIIIHFKLEQNSFKTLIFILAVL